MFSCTQVELPFLSEIDIVPVVNREIGEFVDVGMLSRLIDLHICKEVSSTDAATKLF